MDTISFEQLLCEVDDLGPALDLNEVEGNDTFDFALDEEESKYWNF